MVTVLAKQDIDYFESGKRENPDFWIRFGGKPDFRGKRVLDLGCGHGSLCVDVALSGAKKVIGVDLYQPWITFARTYTNLHYPELGDVLEFDQIDIKDYEGEPFDYMMSKAAFEHVIELGSVLQSMCQRLKRGGRIFTGFGPLYYSPVGDHGRTQSLIPWGHAFQPDWAIVKRLNIKRHDKINSIHDLGLNKYTPADYRKIFNESGMKVILYKENLVMPSASARRRLIGEAMALFKQIGFLEKYFTVNIWCILEKA
jgi:SAM-dependent methyltransferase